MGMGSNKKRGSPGVVVLCLVLGLALLVIEAAAKDTAYCQELCRGQRGFDQIRCLDICIWGPGHGVAARLAAHRRAGGGSGVGQLAAFQPGTAAYCQEYCEYAWHFQECYDDCLDMKDTRGVGGWQEEKKMKQEDVVLHLTDPAYCYDFCKRRMEGEEDLHQCIIDCYGDLPEAAGVSAHGGAGGEEASGGAVDALTAADALKYCIRYCERRGADGRCQAWRCRRLHQAGWESTQTEEEVEETRGGGAVDVPAAAAAQHEVAAGTPSRGRCEAYCRNHYDASSPAYAHCMYMCPRLAAHGVAQGEAAAAAGGRGAGQEDAPSA